MLVRRTIASHRVLRLQSDTFGSGLLRVAPEHSNLDSRLVLPPGHYSARQCQWRTADGAQQSACAASGSQRRRLQFALVTPPEPKSLAPKPPQNFRASDRVRSTGLNTMREKEFSKRILARRYSADIARQTLPSFRLENRPLARSIDLAAPTAEQLEEWPFEPDAPRYRVFGNR